MKKFVIELNDFSVKKAIVEHINSEYNLSLGTDDVEINGTDGGAVCTCEVM